MLAAAFNGSALELEGSDDWMVFDIVRLGSETLVSSLAVKGVLVIIVFTLLAGRLD